MVFFCHFFLNRLRLRECSIIYYIAVLHIYKPIQIAERKKKYDRKKIMSDYEK